jgi:hypothetical protein
MNENEYQRRLALLMEGNRAAGGYGFKARPENQPRVNAAHLALFGPRPTRVVQQDPQWVLNMYRNMNQFRKQNPRMSKDTEMKLTNLGYRISKMNQTEATQKFAQVKANANRNRNKLLNNIDQGKKVGYMFPANRNRARVNIVRRFINGPDTAPQNWYSKVSTWGYNTGKYVQPARNAMSRGNMTTLAGILRSSLANLNPAMARNATNREIREILTADIQKSLRNF